MNNKFNLLASGIEKKWLYPAFVVLIVGGFKAQNTASLVAGFNASMSGLETFARRDDYKATVENERNSQNGFGSMVTNTLYINFEAEAVKAKNLLLDIERPTEFSMEVSEDTRQAVFSRSNLYTLIVLKREIEEDLDPLNSDFIKLKVKRCIDQRISRLSKLVYPYYTYRTYQAMPVKFVSIGTGNDLFTVAGLYATLTGKETTNSKPYFQRNDDRDYTGSFLIEIGTDYFRLPRRRKLKTYQTLLWGFDVFTPYFKDTIAFPKNDTFNVKDRPHASFQYFGWSKKGISLRDKYRWAFTFKFGKIGGYSGANFQTVLHQDVSFSPRPRGWGAQIANNGRLGISLEGVHEWNKKLYEHPSKDNYFWNLHLVSLVEYKVGTYMTNGGIGLAISNKNFKQNNHNFINHRTKQNVRHWNENLMYKVSFNTVFVQHNTMLQGYGIFSTGESKDDKLTPVSKHKLTVANVNPFVSTFAITWSYTARFFTVYYKWSSISSEMRGLDDIGFKRFPGDSKNMSIKDRWHHFAIIGVSFNIVD